MNKIAARLCSAYKLIRVLWIGITLAWYTYSYKYVYNVYKCITNWMANSFLCLIVDYERIFMTWKYFSYFEWFLHAGGVSTYTLHHHVAMWVNPNISYFALYVVCILFFIANWNVGSVYDIKRKHTVNFFSFLFFQSSFAGAWIWCLYLPREKGRWRWRIGVSGGRIWKAMGGRTNVSQLICIAWNFDYNVFYSFCNIVWLCWKKPGM